MHGRVGVTTFALQKEDPVFASRPQIILYEVCMFSPCTQGFPPGIPAQHMNTLKIPYHGWLFCISLCILMMDWSTDQGVSCL